MSVIKRGKWWHYRFVHQGREYSKSTGLEATKQWLSAARKKESDAYHAVVNGQDWMLNMQVRPFNDAARAFLAWADGEYAEHPATAGRLRTSFVSLLRYFGERCVHVLTAGDVEGYKTFRRSGEDHGRVKEVTLRHDLHALSGFFQFAQKQNWCHSNPVRNVEIPSDKDSVRIHVLSAEEERAYFGAAAKFPALYDLGRLMLNQGCRPDEVLHIRVEDVDLERGELHIPRGKSRAARRVLTLTAESRSILARRIAGVVGSHGVSAQGNASDDLARQQSIYKLGKDGLPKQRIVLESLGESRKEDAYSPAANLNGWVFSGKHGPLTKVNGSHDKALKASGTRFVLYDLRHSFATRCAARGMPLAVLAAILGHSSLRCVMKYVHIQPEHMREAMLTYGEKLEERTVVQ